jgi:alkaline phosphatase D
MFILMTSWPLIIIESKFKVQYPYVKEMKELGTQIIGTWDDHDYGVNDGNKTFIHKNYTREWFLDFLEEPSDSPRRLQK